MKTETQAVDIDRDKGDFAYPEVHVRDAGRGLSEKTIHYISDVKEDPDWVREFRLRGLKTFLETAADALGEQGFGGNRFRQDPLLSRARHWGEAQLGRSAG